MQLNPGTLLQGGKYKIIRTLGQGGFGITYLAEDTSLEMNVCIKELFIKTYSFREESTSEVSLGTEGNAEMMQKYLEKFSKEAKTIARLNHPNIIHIHDVFQENSTAYYVMEYIEGSNLNDIVKTRGALPEAEALEYIRAIGGGLAYVHSKGLNHLDVKPGNIMLRDEDKVPVLIDFGMSKHCTDAGEQTSSIPVMLSPGYAPIELYDAGGVSQFSPQTDVYSLAATLYRLVTGQVPPPASEVANKGLLELPSSLTPQTRSAIEKGMQFRKMDRPQTVQEFLSILESKDSAEQPSCSATSSPAEPEVKTAAQPHENKSQPSESKSNKRIWGIVGGAIAAIALVVALIIAFGHSSVKVSSATGRIGAHDYVDLGLSVKWATCNLGAASPEDYGNYYAWGETSTKHIYTWSNLKYCLDDSGDKFSKYIVNFKSRNVGNKTQLDPEDDAATVNWGGSWRMPTESEWLELQDNCTWEWLELNGKNGYKVTGKNGNSIFLPAGGFRLDGNLRGDGVVGSYWFSSFYTLDNVYMDYSANSNSAQGYYFYSVYMGVYYDNRCRGQSVRPVSK